MKKILILASAALAVFAACSKEVDNAPAEKVQGEKKTVSFIAELDATKATETNAVFSWKMNDAVAVVDKDDDAVNYFYCTTEDNAAIGKFTGTHSGEFAYAIAPFSAAKMMEHISDGTDEVIDYTITLPETYTDYIPGTTNAVMVGTPNGTDKFLFRHAAALLKFTVANVPVGTKSFWLKTNKKIAGEYTFSKVTGVEISETSTEETEVTLELKDEVTTANTTLDFYIPVPTGKYTNFIVTLYNKSLDELASVSKSGLNITLNRGDVYYTPTITLDAVKTKSYVKVTDDAGIEEGDYLIVYEAGNLAFNGGLETLDAVSNTISVTIANDAIASNATTDASVFHIAEVTGGYSIKSASGYYIGQTGDSNGLATSTTNAYTNTISFDSEGNADIVSSAYLRYNSASNQLRFRYYKSSTYTGQKPIALYKLADNTNWTLVSIEITTPPTKTTYDAGESFDPAGMVVTAHYVDADDNTNTKDAVVTNYAINPDGVLSADNTLVTISFEGKTATQAITVIEWVLDGIAITTPPTKTAYDAGETFDPTGMVVTATYKDRKNASNTREVEVSGYTISPDGALTLDDTTITITFEGKTATQTITVAVASGWIETAIADLAADDVFVIVGNNGSNYAMSNDKGTSAAPTAVSVTVQGNKVTSEVPDNIKWTISGNATDGYIFYPYGSTETWLYCISDNNGARVGIGDNKVFTISNEGYLYNSGQSRYIGIYNSSDWRSYTSINNNIKDQTFKFYRFLDPREPAGMSWSDASATATITNNGTTFTAPTLTAGNATGITYKSTKPEVASIDASTGAVTILAEGTTKIQAIFAGDATYKPATVEYTLVVTDDRTYAITVTQPTEGGTISATPSGSLKAGTEITLSAEAANGYKFSEWNVFKTGDENTKVTVTDNAFLMPSYPVTVTASFVTATATSDYDATIKFGSASGSTNVNGASVTGNDSQGNTWTVTTAGTTSFTPNSAYAQIGSKNSAASSITFTTTLEKDATIKAMSAKFGGFSGTAGTVTLKVGNTTIGTGSLNATNDVTVNATTTTAVGKVLTVTVTGISKGVKAYEINVTYNN